MSNKSMRRFSGFIGEKKLSRLSRKTDFTSVTLYHDLKSPKKSPIPEIEEWCRTYAVGRICYQVFENWEPCAVYTPDGSQRTEYRITGHRHCVTFENSNVAFAFKMQWA
jgi:hypothetical protein